MDYRERIPSPRFQSLVACIWAFASPRSWHRVLPDGCIDILLRNERASVVGTMRRAVKVPSVSTAVLGIRLRPGEASRLFPGASELTDSSARLEELWGNDGRVLEAVLVDLLAAATREGMNAATILRRAQPHIEAALLARLAAHGESVDLRVRAVASLLASGTQVRVAAEHVGLSERQLARRFIERVGVGPKMFARVRRLQYSARLLSEGFAPSVTAMMAGYADQAHFTRDSSEIAGVPPGVLLREVLDEQNTTIAVGL
jgi:methylphosphotriester-DNA--protein-cysteine methyltransferase